MKNFAVNKKLTLSALVLGSSFLLGSNAYAADVAVKSFEGTFSGLIVKEEHDDARGHVMEVEGTFRGNSGITGTGKMTLFLEGHHAHKPSTKTTPTGNNAHNHDHDDHDHDDHVAVTTTETPEAATAECNKATGQGKLVLKTGTLSFSQAGEVCIKVQGIENPRIHLFNGAYYFNAGTNKLKGYFGSGNLSGSFIANPSVDDPKDKQVILRFNGASGQKI